jgi:hypothetical protein
MSDDEHSAPASAPASAAALPTAPPDRAETVIAALEKRAQFLNVQYGVLFGGSMLLLVYNWTGGRTTATTIAWAAMLCAAVITRVVRTSLVNKINAAKNSPTIV